MILKIELLFNLVRMLMSIENSHYINIIFTNIIDDFKTPFSYKANFFIIINWFNWISIRESM